MDELISLVRTYRVTEVLDQRVRLGDEIFRRIEPDLRFFVLGSISRPEAEDALQEVLKAIATSLNKFSGSSHGEFWAWCYRIARNKLNDHFREKAADRAESMAPDELWTLVEARASGAPVASGVRLDLDYAMKLLSASKPACHELLWKHYVLDLDYSFIAAQLNLQYDNVRIKIARCLELAQSLVT